MKAHNTKGTAESYYCFTRTWWRKNPEWPGGREPGAGPRHIKAKGMTLQEAQDFCREWNKTHDPGFLSLKCEFDEE